MIHVEDFRYTAQPHLEHMLCLLGIIFLTKFLVTSASSELGSFWQLTDIHYDSMYNDPLLHPFLCRSTEGLRNSSTGRTTAVKYGDYNCDSPWMLVVSAINAMTNYEPHPDFILWTGDSIPHVPVSGYNQSEVFQLISNITSYLTMKFPNVTIYPLLGNHDIWPANQYPGASDKYYVDILRKTGWYHLLNAPEVTSFEKGGFYSMQLKSGLRLVMLNTNLYYYQDDKTANLTDPAGQLAWLDDVLKDAEQRNDSVLIVGHIPPGICGRCGYISWMRPSFNEKFVGLLRQHHSVIVAAIFGHEHTDAFHVIYDNNHDPIISLFLAPAVTPWFSTLPGVGSNNPAIRLYKYSRPTGRVVDYTQYFLNLTAADTTGHDNWTVEYHATETYDISDVDAESLSDLVKKFANDSHSPNLFARYYRYNSVSHDLSNCTGLCKTQQICAASEVEFDRYILCLQSSHSDTESTQTTTHGPHRRHHRRRLFEYVLLGSVIMVVGVVFVVLAFCCCQRRHAVVYFSRSHYSLIQDA